MFCLFIFIFQFICLHFCFPAFFSNHSNCWLLIGRLVVDVDSRARACPSKMSEFLREDFFWHFCRLCKKTCCWIDFGPSKLLVLVSIFLSVLEFWIYKLIQKFPREFPELQSKGKAKQCSFKLHIFKLWRTCLVNFDGFFIKIITDY